MKLLRVLSGIHTGAQLLLNSIALRVGADFEADIRISDWQSPSMVLTFDDQGAATFEPIARPEIQANADTAVDVETAVETAVEKDVRANPDANDLSTEKNVMTLNHTMTLTDFMPVKFGEIILCIGNESATWPNDAELLRQLWTPTQSANAASAASPEAAEAADKLAEAEITAGTATTAETTAKPLLRRQRMIAYAAGAILVITIFASTAIWSQRRAAQAAQAANLNTIAQRVEQTFNGAKLRGLQVTVRGNTVVISGMVATSSEDIAVRQIIDHINNRGVIARQYDIASNITENITESLGIPGVNIQYAGAGVFRVTGTVSDLNRAQQALKRLDPDFSGNVRRIESMLTEAPPANANPAYSGLMSSDSVKYFETPDGVKHLYPTNTGGNNELGRNLPGAGRR